MSWPIMLFTFILLWWISLFAFISAGHRPSAHSTPGQSSGAPERPYLRQKFLAALCVSALLTTIIYVAAEYSGLRIFDYDYYSAAPL